MDMEEYKFTGKEAVCPNCAYKMRYRLVKGTSFEGVSIREILYDEKDEIVGWGAQPVLVLTNSAADVKKEIIKAFKDLDDMLEATKLPIIDETDLEKRML